ncbi:ragulator complex protein LAMTOR1-like isoform X2 [Notamacropus eugenii]|uniref:ragulator complex protein LAMTOR1-like isoform X2 n=1 Tax=Notamacropus eugenii TaxID=9315 RepID=UPI003B677DF2
MGSCCCRFKEEEETVLVPEERVRLLEPPGEQDRASTSDSQTCQDEQSLLAAILARTASSLINVAAAQSLRLTPHEYRERALLYHKRLAMVNLAVVRIGGVGEGCDGSGGCSGRLRSYWKKKQPPSTPLPSLTNQPHHVLAEALVPYADVQQAIRIAGDAHHAMQHVRVQHQEELVVPFEVV